LIPVCAAATGVVGSGTSGVAADFNAVRRSLRPLQIALLQRNHGMKRFSTELFNDRFAIMVRRAVMDSKSDFETPIFQEILDERIDGAVLPGVRRR
jgi:hypothetical protein